MKFAVRFLQIGDGQAQISLGGGKGAVAEHFLNVAQVGVVFEQMRRARVPPEVRGDFLFNPGLPGVFLDNVPNAVSAQGVTMSQRNKKNVGDMVSQQFRPDRFDVGFQKLARHP